MKEVTFDLSALFEVDIPELEAHLFACQEGLATNVPDIDETQFPQGQS